MMKIQPQWHTLKNSTELKIREATLEDAEDILLVAKSVIDEEIYQLTASHEFKITLEQERKWIQTHLEKPLHLLLVAEIDHQIVGVLDFSNNLRERISHVGEFGISVLKQHRHIGVGSAVLKTLIDWAKSTHKIEKINLQVHSYNEHAIRAYKQNGFVVEGTRKLELKYNSNKYADSVLMTYFVKKVEKSNESSFPLLKTDRLILRQFELSDAKAVQRLAGHPLIAETTATIPHPYLDGLAEDWISKHQTWFDQGVSVDFAIVLKSSEELIGNISLIINKSNQKAEIGYWIGLEFWNKGYCTEAMQEVIRYAFKDRNLNKITCRHIMTNPSSGRVMIKAGLVQEGYLKQELFKRNQFYDIVVYGLLRSEWNC